VSGAALPAARPEVLSVSHPLRGARRRRRAPGSATRRAAGSAHRRGHRHRRHHWTEHVHRVHDQV